MKPKTIFVIAPFLFPAVLFAQTQSADSSFFDRGGERVYTNRHFELTGISVSQDDRLFVNFPRWSDRYLNAVIEAGPDGTQHSYPNVEWNRWDGKPQTAANHFVCVQSVVVDHANTLWVVDAAAPLLTSPVPNGPKLVRIDLATNEVSQIIPIGPDVALPDSYLNDIRIDNSRNFAYLTDSGHGGIVVVDIANGEAWRKLDGHPSVLGDPAVPVIVNGQVLKQPNGKPAVFNSDSIEMSKDGNKLFYKPINSLTLWSVPTDLLRNRTSDAAIGVTAAAGNLFPTDGLWLDSKGRIYLTTSNTLRFDALPSAGRLKRCSSRAGLNGRTHLRKTHRAISM